jgi:hypothetical protein
MKYKILTGLMLLVIFFAGCTKAKDKLLGTWSTVSNATTVYFTFQKNNELNVNNEVFMNYFVTNDKKLVLGREEPALFSVNGDTLRIKQGSHMLTFKKVNKGTK